MNSIWTGNIELIQPPKKGEEKEEKNPGSRLSLLIGSSEAEN